MKKKKLSLTDLKVNSFVTELNGQGAKGGVQIVSIVHQPGPIGPVFPVETYQFLSCGLQPTGQADPKCSGIDNCNTAWICDPITADPIEPIPNVSALICF